MAGQALQPLTVDAVPIAGQQLLENAGFRLLEPVGVGGTATVFRGICLGNAIKKYEISTQQAEQEGITLDLRENKYFKEVSLAGRPCAVKYFPTPIGFQKESSILMDLNHPNIVDIYGVLPFEFFDEIRLKHKVQVFIITEYLDGGTLLDFEQRHIFSQDGCINAMRQLCDGIVYMHDQNVIHRDIHHGNIMKTHAPGHPVWKFVDFGDADKHVFDAEDSFDEEYSMFSSDIYAFGSDVLYRIFEKTLFTNNVLKDRLRLVINRMMSWSYKTMGDVMLELNFD